MEDLKEKVIIISGASDGIGAATAVEFAKCGAWLSLTGRNQDRLQNTAAKCYALGIPKGKVLLTACDLEDTEKSCVFIVKETIDRFGKIDVLVNCAGFDLMKTFESTTQDEMDQQYRLLLRAPFFLSQKALPHLKETKGCVINISAMLSKTVFPPYFAYSIMKAGVDYFSQALAAVASSSGVRVNVVSPGLVNTKSLTNQIPPEELPQALKEYAKIVPLGSISEPSEIATSVVFLASAKAKTITGATLAHDGGFGIPQVQSGV